MNEQQPAPRRRFKQFGRSDSTVLWTMGIVGAGTVLYRLGQRLGGGRSATALEIAQPFIWALPIAIVMLIVRRETIKGRLRAGLCSKCEKELEAGGFSRACPECGRVNSRWAPVWLVGKEEGVGTGEE